MVDPQGKLSVARQCALLRLSRSSLYYEPKGESEENLALMRRIDELYMACPFYGSRQMARHLSREGPATGRHRVRRLMRLMGLEAVYRKPRTSDPHPAHRVYPYLLGDVEVDAPNQAWCSDITYIPVRHGFLYLVAVMDWATRCVLSWRLSNTMDAAFCVEALEAALSGGRRHRCSTPTRGRSSPARRSPSGCWPRGRSARWTAGAGAWTTCSSSACGVR